jgi:hypothetical protein
MDDKVYDEASTVEARDGAVSVDGPDGVDVRLSPEAALETSDRLLESAAEAQGQQAAAARAQQRLITDAEEARRRD